MFFVGTQVAYSISMSQLSEVRSSKSLRIVLLSPQGPLYRRGGIFKQSFAWRLHFTARCEVRPCADCVADFSPSPSESEVGLAGTSERPITQLRNNAAW